ncbi:hypothetical protein [Methylocystis sp. ATCC 49242]|uniref:hypothetical protein n=1 Tax=Methylocystis sp. ATCC 49242 TaxID=622637 RepID=UPI0001F885FF|nr:hypothetical protein [Methylocystis sp. ATCC 49242]
MNDEFEIPTAPEGLADFWIALMEDGCDMRHVHKMLKRIETERAAATAAAARMFFQHDSNKPLSLVELLDGLRELRRQALTLELAIIGACGESRLGDCGETLSDRARELCRGVERFERAFSAELQMVSEREQQ